MVSENLCQIINDQRNFDKFSFNFALTIMPTDDLAILGIWYQRANWFTCTSRWNFNVYHGVATENTCLWYRNSTSVAQYCHKWYIDSLVQDDANPITNILK